MKKILFALVLTWSCVLSSAQDLKRTPVAWKWISEVRPPPQELRVAIDMDAFGLV